MVILGLITWYTTAPLWLKIAVSVFVGARIMWDLGRAWQKSKPAS